MLSVLKALFFFFVFVFVFFFSFFNLLVSIRAMYMQGKRGLKVKNNTHMRRAGGQK